MPDDICVYCKLYFKRVECAHMMCAYRISKQVTKGSVSYLSFPCFSTIIGGIGGPARGKRRILDVMY